MKSVRAGGSRWWQRGARLALAAIPVVVAALAGMGAPAARAATYFIAPNGDDGAGGRSERSPFRTFPRAVENLSAGDTLVVLDGTYPIAENGTLTADCTKGASSGSSSAWITVEAQDERQGWIKGDGSAIPVQVRGCQYWRLQGLRVSSADAASGATHNVLVAQSTDVELKRLLVHDVNRYTNSGGIGVNRSQRVLVEEAEVYFFHRHGIGVWKSNAITVRRSYIDGRGAADIPGGFASHDCCTQGGDDAVSLYFTSNSLVENIVTSDSEGVFTISGDDTAAGNPGGQNNRKYGNISFQDLRLGGVFSQSRKLGNNSQPVKDVDIRDLLVIGGAETVAADMRGGSVTLRHATFLDTRGPAINIMFKAQGHFAACDPWPCAYGIEDSLFIGVPPPVLNIKADPVNMSLRLRNVAAGRDGRAAPVDFALAAVDGTIAGTKDADDAAALRRCPIVPPPGAAAGSDGRPAGATILKRTENGVETREPLWDPATGAFPCGAVVAGVNDVPGSSCTDIHSRLNVSPGNCPLRQ